MDYLQRSLFETNSSPANYPIKDRIQVLLNSNMAKIEEQYSRYTRRISSSHFLIKLIHRLYSYFGDTPEDTFYNIKFDVFDIGQDMQMISPSSSQKVYNDTYGLDFYLAADDLDITFISGRVVLESNVNILDLIYHESFELIPDLVVGVSDSNHSVTKVNIPAFGAYLHQWHLTNNTKAIKEDISSFINTYCYLPLFRNHLDIAFYNRLTQVVRSSENQVSLDRTLLDFNKVVRVNNVALINLEPLIDDLVVTVAKTLMKRPQPFYELINDIPLISRDKAKELYPEINNKGLNQIEWINAGLQGWLFTTSNDIANNLDVPLSGNTEKFYTRNLTSSRKSSLRQYVPKTEREWFDTITEL